MERTDLRSPGAAALAAVACLVALGCAGAIAYGSDTAQRLDAAALHGLEALDGGTIGHLASVLAQLGGPPALLVALVSTVFLGWHWGRRRQALAAAAVLIGANVTTQVLKVVLAHPRYQPILGVNQVDAAAFPSGHATSAMSIAVAMLLVAPERLRAVAGAAGAAIFLAVSISILILGWHYPSDVLGGILVAAAFGFAALALLRRGEPIAALARGRARPRAPSPAARRVLEAGAIAAALLVAVTVLARAGEILSYADLHPASVLVAGTIALVAVSVLTLFGTATDV